MSEYMKRVKIGPGYVMVLIALCIYLPYLLLPVVAVVLPQIIRYLIIMSSTVLLLIGGLETTKKNFLFFYGTFFLIVVFSVIYYLGIWKVQDASFQSILATSLMFWNGLLFSKYIITNFSEAHKRRAYNFTVLLITVTIMTTIVGNLLFPEASRLLASGSNDPSLTLFYRRINIGGYGFVYSLVIATPIFVYKFKECPKKIEKVLYFFLVLLVGLLCLITQYTIAFITYIVMIFIMILLKPKNKLLSVILLLIALFIVYLSGNILIKLLENFSNFLDGMNLSTVSDRIKNLLDILYGNEVTGDSEYRSMFYLTSWNQFISSPFYGAILSPTSLGGHSEVLDVLGGTGLFGTTFLVALLHVHVKSIKKINLKKKYFIFSLLSFLVIGSLNTVLNSMPIAISLFLLPALITDKHKSSITASKNQSHKSLYETTLE
jgi:hypothetical protein